jgi:hypothetical protein
MLRSISFRILSSMAAHSDTRGAGGLEPKRGPGAMMGRGGAMPCSTTEAAANQPLPPGQLEQFGKQHAISVDQAKDMAKQCQQMMKTSPAKTQ